MVWKLLPPITDAFLKTIVTVIGIKLSGLDRDYRDAVEQLMGYLNSAEDHNRDQELRSYLLIGDRCSTFRFGQGHGHVDRGLALTGPQDYMTDELCRMAIRYWNQD